MKLKQKKKVADKDELFEFMLTRLKDHPQESNGIGQLIFEMFKGVKKQFNGCTDDVMLLLILLD